MSRYLGLQLSPRFSNTTVAHPASARQAPGSWQAGEGVFVRAWSACRSAFVGVAGMLGGPHDGLSDHHGDEVERFVMGELAQRGPLTHMELVSSVSRFIAWRERSMGGGALDLFAWGDEMWRDEAERAVARLKGDRW
jgi:hypothetical protein